MSGILSCHLILTAFSNSLSENGLVSLQTLVYFPLWQYHSLADVQLGGKLDSISLPDLCAESPECHTGVCNYSGNDLIINVIISGESASQVGELSFVPSQ